MAAPPLRVVLDDWLSPPLPPVSMPVQFGDYPAWRSWQLDALLATRLNLPGPLCLVTGI